MIESFSESFAFKVAAYQYFTEKNWKQALTFFLDGINLEKPKIMYNPQFHFMSLGINLYLDKKKRIYCLDCPQGESHILYPRPIFSELQICLCYNQQLDVEDSLRIFINQYSCRMLELWLVPKKFFLWKDKKELLRYQIEDITSENSPIIY